MLSPKLVKLLQFKLWLIKKFDLWVASYLPLLQYCAVPALRWILPILSCSVLQLQFIKFSNSTTFANTKTEMLISNPF